MKKQLLLNLIFISSISGFAQQLYIEYGSNVLSFDYKNSQGMPLDNLLPQSKTYLGMGYRDNINREKTLYLSLGATYNGYGAIGSDLRLDNYFEWDVSYLGVTAGLDIKLFQLNDFLFYIKGAIATEFLIRGNQTINNQVYNLVGEDEFNSSIFFIKGSLGMQYPISRSTAIFANYTFGKTVLINSDTSEETLKLNAHQFGFGFIINLPNCNCDN
ncbi:outer membrane beta-barrel protein [Flavivirga aquimarina]|uniref:Outer membrane beta-barrel protein n=1 Tax=Flavivirga aquimarina TaxID=2027862 RepID=A0ABT8WG19_9FLAO|nr:outer membrane beta-barrel protein [Flavivirga aquimarina]MDO5972096.1 outer membrane beta-barrel protein [Flavivirga aquimarina]